MVVVEQGYVLNERLCVSCGICAAVCPKQCIEMTWRGGQALPEIDASQCISCKKCEAVCGNRISPPAAAWEAHAIECYSAWERDAAKLSASASGGVVTAIIEKLLKDGAYDSAYLVGEMKAGGGLSAERYQAGDDLNPTRKSKYVPISFQEAAKDMIAGSGSRMILVATPCVIKSLRNLIKMHHLNQADYLLIGLFCDRTLNYNIVPYFQRFGGKSLRSFHFKDKGKHGWPGEVKLFFEDGTEKDLSRLVRLFSKEYFQLECCLYCSDKLNEQADISVGDDYTDRKTPMGRSSVIVRTPAGKEAFSQLQIGKESCGLAEIEASQAVQRKEKNRAFRSILCTDGNADQKAGEAELAARIAKIELGRNYPDSRRARLKIHRAVNTQLAVRKLKAVKRWITHAGKNS